MNVKYNNTVGNLIFSDVDENEYLNEIYEQILRNYAITLFNVETEFCKDIIVEDALRFADILSKSTVKEKVDSHKNWAQEIVALLDCLYPNSDKIQYYLGSILTYTGNYYGMSKVTPNYKNLSFLEYTLEQSEVENMFIPAEPDRKFINAQKDIYNRLDEEVFSYSAPTSMGKSFIIRMFIKKQLMDDVKNNFVILVPTKALINEVYCKIIADLKDLLKNKNYRVITSPLSPMVKRDSNFIFVVTPERLLYLLLENESININYLFIDEAHKISADNSRSAMYYNLIDMLNKQEIKPHIIFSSPNIPNPEVYFKLLQQNTKEIAENNFVTKFSPVSQIKYYIDLEERTLNFYNARNMKFSKVADLQSNNLNDLISSIDIRFSQSLVYCNTQKKAIDYALEYAKGKNKLFDEKLMALSKKIREDIHVDYYLADLVEKGVAYHIGNLPQDIRNNLEKLFSERRIKIIFCTSTLLEGVNLPADNLFVTSYQNGVHNMNEVDFNNLVGRAGRIDFGLFGNVILVRMLGEKIAIKNGFERLLNNKPPIQKVSLETSLTREQKLDIIKCLKTGNLESIYSEEENEKNRDLYYIKRKFALILLKNIQDETDSYVKSEFLPLFEIGDIEQIKCVFSNMENQSYDIEISPSQAKKLYDALISNLEYPKLSEDFRKNYNTVLDFLENLCTIFEWEKTERFFVGKIDDKNTHPKLRRYTFLILEWFKSKKLKGMIDKALEYKSKKPNNAMYDSILKSNYNYDGSVAQKNIVINDTLKDVEYTLLFKMSNYFLRFSSEYKKIQGIKSFENDWYEFLEYGTTNTLALILQKNGLSKETSNYIIEHSHEYVVNTDDGIKIKDTFLECCKESVCREVKDLQFNVPELFVEC